MLCSFAGVVSEEVYILALLIVPGVLWWGVYVSGRGACEFMEGISIGSSYLLPPQLNLPIAALNSWGNNETVSNSGSSTP